jgi:hypothetical protein
MGKKSQTSVGRRQEKQNQINQDRLNGRWNRNKEEGKKKNRNLLTVQRRGVRRTHREPQNEAVRTSGAIKSKRRESTNFFFLKLLSFIDIALSTFYIRQLERENTLSCNSQTV